MTLEVGIQLAATELREIARTKDGKTSTIVLFKPGANPMFGMDDVIMDEAGAELVIKAFQDQGVEIPIDYEHATVVKGEKGEAAPAVGWVTAFEWNPEIGLLATVNWSDEARSQIKSGAYRYYSPVMFVDKKSRRVTRVHSIGLTNKPRTKGQRELVAASVGLLEESMATKTKPKAAEPAEEKVVAQEGEPMAGGQTPEQLIGQLQAVLEMNGATFDDNADMVAVLKAAIAKLKGDSGESEGEGEAAGEAASENTEMETKETPKGSSVKGALALAASLLEKGKAQDDNRVEQAVQRFIAAAKLNPNDPDVMAWARETATADIAGFEAIMGSAPAVGPKPGTKTAPTKATATRKGGKREEAIVAAAREYGEGIELFNSLGNRLDFSINRALAEQGMQPIDEAELQLAKHVAEEAK